MKVYSLKFWNEVKEDYEKGDLLDDPFICGNSYKFSKMWSIPNNGDNEVMELAHEFLSEIPRYEELFYISDLYLFNYKFPVSTSNVPNEGHIEVRKDFINWCIKKFSN